MVKTALKLLLVFVEYTEANTSQLIKAITSVDSRRGLQPWTNIMQILGEKEGADSELLVYTMTLVNKVGHPALFVGFKKIIKWGNDLGSMRKFRGK